MALQTSHSETLLHAPLYKATVFSIEKWTGHKIAVNHARHTALLAETGALEEYGALMPSVFLALSCIQEKDLLAAGLPSIIDETLTHIHALPQSDGTTFHDQAAFMLGHEDAFYAHFFLVRHMLVLRDVGALLNDNVKLFNATFLTPALNNCLAIESVHERLPAPLMQGYIRAVKAFIDALKADAAVNWFDDSAQIGLSMQGSLDLLEKKVRSAAEALRLESLQNATRTRLTKHARKGFRL